MQVSILKISLDNSLNQCLKFKTWAVVTKIKAIMNKTLAYNKKNITPMNLKIMILQCRSDLEIK